MITSTLHVENYVYLIIKTARCLRNQTIRESKLIPFNFYIGFLKATGSFTSATYYYGYKKTKIHMKLFISISTSHS